MLEVTAGIIFSDSKILIARRAPEKHLAGYWEFPGGKIEDGETAENCLKRELEEELGIVVSVGDLFMENEHQYGDRKIHLQAFFCELLSGDIVLNDHDRIEWIRKDEFHTYQFAPADIPFIEALVNES